MFDCVGASGDTSLINEHISPCDTSSFAVVLLDLPALQACRELSGAHAMPHAFTESTVLWRQMLRLQPAVARRCSSSGQSRTSGEARPALP